VAFLNMLAAARSAAVQDRAGAARRQDKGHEEATS